MENTSPPPVQIPSSPSIASSPSHQTSATWHYNAFLYLIIGVVLGSFGSYFVLLNTMTPHSKPADAIAVAASPTLVQPEPSIVVPTTNEIASSPSAYTTYVSSTGIFSFQYPSNWDSVDVRQSGGLEAELDIPLTPDCLPPHVCGGNRAGIRVQTFQNPKLLTIPAFITAINYGDPTGYVKNPNSLGIPGEWRVNRQAPGGGNAQAVFISHGKYMIYLSCECNDQMFDTILSTFQFLK